MPVQEMIESSWILLQRLHDSRSLLLRQITIAHSLIHCTLNCIGYYGLQLAR